MAFSYADLRKKTDDELVTEHDQAAQITQPTVDYYLAELRHRDIERLTNVMRRLTWLIVFLTLANVVAVLWSL